VEDKELKYGLSVTGFIHPDRVLTKKNLKAKDRLILTKPLGTGIINTAIKGGLASEEVIENVTQLMATLNRDAAEIMNDYPVHACTDITGFGLLGHIAEMVIDSKLGIEIRADKIPVITEAIEYAGLGFVPGGAYKNRDFRESVVDFAPSVDLPIKDIFFDPQTSGGLLISVERESADDLVKSLKKNGINDAAVIGEVLSGPVGRVVVK